MPCGGAHLSGRRPLLIWRFFKAGLAHLIRVLTLLWLIIHFTLTTLYVLPVNPVKLYLQPLLILTIGTYFPQNWSLFAPNPVSSNHALLVRPLSDEEFADMTTKGMPADGWYDLTSPLWSHFQQNRFSAYDRLARPQSNGIRAYFSGGPELSPWWEACKKGDPEACQFSEEQFQIRRSQASAFLSKIGSSFCNSLPQNSKINHFALRVRESSSVAWSERYTSAPIVRDLEIGIYPVDKTVISNNLYSVGGSR